MVYRLADLIVILDGQLYMLIGIPVNCQGHVGSVKNMKAKNALIQIAHLKI